MSTENETNEQVDAPEVAEDAHHEDVGTAVEDHEAGAASEPAGDEPAEVDDTVDRRLHAALVALDGRLQDATDLPFDPGHLDDEEALTEAITELVERKPHLKKREFAPDIGGGNRGSAAPESPDLINIIRGMI